MGCFVYVRSNVLTGVAQVTSPLPSCDVCQTRLVQVSVSVIIKLFGRTLLKSDSVRRPSQQINTTLPAECDALLYDDRKWCVFLDR